jgi:protein-disulfide isomerase-like protein with CxxC motif
VTTRFGITFDYLCPFARNANEHVIAGLRGGSDWSVEFVPFSLAQGHVDDGEAAVWDRDQPNLASGVLALQVGIAVREHAPDRFLDVHEALFAARHDLGHDIKDRAVLSRVLIDAGVDPEQTFDAVDDGTPLKLLREEHEAAVRDHQVWGVPTFIAGGRAVFVRLMDRPDGDTQVAARRIEQVVGLVVDAPQLHEFKQTDLPA